MKHVKREVGVVKGNTHLNTGISGGYMSVFPKVRNARDIIPSEGKLIATFYNYGEKYRAGLPKYVVIGNTVQFVVPRVKEEKGPIK